MENQELETELAGLLHELVEDAKRYHVAPEMVVAITGLVKAMNDMHEEDTNTHAILKSYLGTQDRGIKGPIGEAGTPFVFEKFNVDIQYGGHLEHLPSVNLSDIEERLINLQPDETMTIKPIKE